MDDCDRAFVSFYMKVGRGYGMDDLSSSIFALLYVSPTEIALEDLARETGYSLASVSNKVKMLESTGCITRIRKPGSKKVFFYAEKDMMKIIIGMMEKIGSVETTLAKSEMPAIIGKLETAGLTSEEKKKIKILRTYLRDMHKFEKMINAMKEAIVVAKQRAESALAESEDKYRLIVENSFDSIFIFRDDKFLFVNTPMSEATGYSQQELKAMNPLDLIHPDDRKRLQKSAQQRIAGKKIPSTGLKARFLTKNGEVRYGTAFSSLIQYQGKPAILGIVRDISDKNG